MSPLRQSHRIQRGFTLVELVMVIVIMGVIGGMVSVFMRNPVDAYIAIGRRAALVDVADTTMRRMGRDIRRALPNSVRTSGGTCIEFIPTKTGGRYRADGTAAGLDFTSADTTFNMLGSNLALPLAQRIVDGDLIVVYNLGIPGSDAYARDNVATVTTSPAGAALAESLAPVETTIPIASTLFPLASGGNRFQVVSGAERLISYVCTAGSLRRVVNALNFTTACPALGPVAAGPSIANNVASCNFTYVPAVQGQSALVTMALQIRDASGTETVSLQHEVHVSNTP